MSDGAKGLTRQQMCDRLAMEFEDGWIVNLGIGIPTLCSNFDFGDKEIIFHAENGVIGYGPLTGPGNEDLHLVNAGGQHVPVRLRAYRGAPAIKRLALILGALALNSSAFAAGIDSRAYGCADLQRMIAVKGFIFINNPNFEDFVVAKASFCGGGDSVQVQLR